MIELYLLSICNAFADGAALIGNSYKVEIKGSDLYIVNLHRWKNGEECRFTELWMVNESDKQSLSSSYLGQNLSSLVEELVESVSEYPLHPRLFTTFAHSIDEFLRDINEEELDQELFEEVMNEQ